MNPYRHHDHHDADSACSASRLSLAGHDDACAGDGGIHGDVAPLGADCIDGTQEGLRRFLAEMAQLTGEAGEVLVLELDGIVTTGMAASQGGLSIAARLPRTGARRAGGVAPDGCELVWHAELGCEVLVRHLALEALRGEPDVLDALMDSAMLARALVAGL